MSVMYRPGIWAQKYKSLPRFERDRVNQQTNVIFAKQTGVVRKLDPRHDRKLCATWLKIRDEVMSGKHQHSLSPFQQAGHLATSIGEFAVDAVELVQDQFSSVPTWLRIARAELKKGVKEVYGEKHNADIMNYIRTCTNIYETDAQKRYTERTGDQGVKWCSAFVNWCITQAGMVGTNNARALSWLDWGKSTEPKPGAIIITQGSSARHVAFVDRVNGELKMLGGNQQKSSGGGDYNQISIRPINDNVVVGYRWPL